jgi:sirohydrochlorin cobaltochelatase
MALEWRGNQPGDGHQHHSEGRAAELDAKIRGWPRHEGNDPYKAGLERLAASLKPLIPTELFAIGYNEFCRPTIAEAIAKVIGQGATRVVVLPTMMTPGGVHSERDIPRALEEVRQAHPGVTIDYLWPFDLASVAALLASHVHKALAASRSPSAMIQ